MVQRVARRQVAARVAAGLRDVAVRALLRLAAALCGMNAPVGPAAWSLCAELVEGNARCAVAPAPAWPHGGPGCFVVRGAPFAGARVVRSVWPAAAALVVAAGHSAAVFVAVASHSAAALVVAAGHSAAIPAHRCCGVDPAARQFGIAWRAPASRERGGWRPAAFGSFRCH